MVAERVAKKALMMEKFSAVWKVGQMAYHWAVLSVVLLVDLKVSYLAGSLVFLLGVGGAEPKAAC